MNLLLLLLFCYCGNVWEIERFNAQKKIEWVQKNMRPFGKLKIFQLNNA